VGGGGGSFLDA